MIVCCQCGEKGTDPLKRCGKCGSKTIKRRSSFDTPLQGDQDRWAKRYLLPDASTTSPYLRRQTVPMPHLSKTDSRQPAPAPLRPHTSPFEVFIDDSNSPTTLHHPLPLPPPILRAKSHNVLRPTLTHAYTSPLPALVASGPSKRVPCDHGCGCGKLAEVINPRKADPHAPIKKRLLGDLRRMCQRPEDAPTVQSSHPHRQAAQSARRGSATFPLPLELPILDSSTNRLMTSSPLMVHSAGIYPSPTWASHGHDRSSSLDLIPPTPAVARDPDYLPLTSIPRDISKPLYPPARMPAETAPPTPILRGFPAVRMDIVPNSTPAAPSVNERRSALLREMSKEVASVTAPSKRVTGSKGLTVPEIRARYEAEKAKAKVDEDKVVVPKRTARGYTPYTWPPAALARPSTHSGRKSPKPKPNIVAETRERYAGLSRRSSSRFPDGRLTSILKPSGPPSHPTINHVRVSTVESSRRTSAPILSRAASISSVATVVVHDLPPILPLPETSEVARLRIVFENVLPGQGPPPGRKFAPTPRDTSVFSLASHARLVSHTSSSKSIVTQPVRHRNVSLLGNSMPPCPCCGIKVAYFDRDRVVGPYGTIWHRSCLRCGKAEGAGKRGVDKKGCGKSLDSGAAQDLDGRVWCKRCSLDRRPKIIRPPSVSPALPPKQPRRIISLKQPRPVKLYSPGTILVRDYGRWPSATSSMSRVGSWRRTSGSCRSRDSSGRIREGWI